GHPADTLSFPTRRSSDLGQEGAVEILEAVHAADDLRDRHLLKSTIALAFGDQPVAKLVEGHEAILTPPNRRYQLVEEGLVAGTIEIATHLVVNHVWSLASRPVMSSSERIESGAGSIRSGSGRPGKSRSSRWYG